MLYLSKKSKSFTLLFNNCIIFILLAVLTNSNLTIQSEFDYDAHDNNKISYARLSENVYLNCPIIDDSELIYIVNNGTMEINFDILFKNLRTTDLLKYFNSYQRLRLINAETQILENIKFSDSGRYYCIYSKNNYYNVKSFLLFVYDLEEVNAHIGETKTLNSAKLDSNSNNLRWYLNGSEYFSNENSNNNNKDLVIKLTDSTKFHTYRLINIKNGASIDFKFVCVGLKCPPNQNSRINAPIITPSNGYVNAGSDVVFSCEAPDLVEQPDNYHWYRVFKTNDNSNNQNDNTELLNSIDEQTALEHDLIENVNSKVLLMSADKSLTIESVNQNHTGWYMCCLVYAVAYDSKNEPALSCSSAHLNVSQAYGKESILMIRKIEDERKKNLSITVTVVLASLVILMVLIVLVILLYRKLKTMKYAQEGSRAMHKNQFYHMKSGFSQSTSSNDTQHTKTSNTDTYSSIQYKLSKTESEKWKIPIDNLKFGDIIGKGAFGVVLYGEVYKTKQIEDNKPITVKIPVAIKKLKEYATPNNIGEIYEELKLMLQVGRHENIVNLIGYSADESSLYIITEYAKFGNLKDYLRKFEEPTLVDKLEPSCLIIYSYQIAKGMEYLHKQNILHRDLAARNILVAEETLVKIADFGLARNIKSDYYYIQQSDGRFPLKWMSPESLTHSKISKESDIWSYGILLWEIFSYGCSPYPSVLPEQTLNLIKSGYRLDKPKDCLNEIYDLMIACWNINPNERPKFVDLALSIEKIFNLVEHDCNMKLNSNVNYHHENEIHISTSTIDECDEKLILNNNYNSSSIPCSSGCNSIPSSISSLGCSDADFYPNLSKKFVNYTNDEEMQKCLLNSATETKPLLNQYYNNSNNLNNADQSSHQQPISDRNNLKYTLTKKLASKFNFRKAAPPLNLISSNQQQHNIFSFV